MVRAATRKWPLSKFFTREEIRMGIVGAAVAFFFTHGLPLWDDDYSQWLAQANHDFFGLLVRILVPFTSEPQTWGYSDRPLEVLLYKVFHLIFGYWGTGFYFVKSIGFGALCAMLCRWMRKLDIDQKITYLAIALFILSTNVLASVLWHSDFGIYSQLLIVSILFWALPEIEKGPTSTSIYKKGIEGLPKAFTKFLLTFFIAVYFGTKLKGDVRLVPMILLLFLYGYRQSKFYVYAIPFSLTFFATLPLSSAFFKHLPPFIPGSAGYQGWTYGTFSLSRVFDFFLSDLFSFRVAPLSVLGGIGVFVAVLGAIYLGYRLYHEKVNAPNEKWGFVITWFLVALFSCGILAPQAQPFQLRYTLIPLVPATLLTAMIMQAGLQEFSRFKWIKHALMVAVVAQCGLHFYHDCQFRKDMGHTVVAIDKIYGKMEHDHPNAQFLFATGFLPYGYKDVNVPSIATRKTFKDGEDIMKYYAGNTYMASWGPTLDARYTVDMFASGCGGSLFDAFFPCSFTEGAYLLKFIGNVTEVVQADDLDKKGNLLGAKQMLDSYYQRDPGNLGAAFILSLYTYRLGDFTRMEQVYDDFGRYFPNHTSVLYNWGLAKQGVHKYDEAAKFFEQAYVMSPKDYSIGFNLADAYYHQGKKSRALATLDELRQAYPTNNSLKDAYSNWSK